MSCISRIAAVTLCAFAFVAPSFCADATDKEATAMVEKAVKFAKANGKEKAFAMFQDSTSEFVKGELYVFVYDTAGTCLAHGQKPKLVGKNRIDVEDVNGKKYIKELVDLGKSKGSGWVEYLFQNPESKKIEPKKTFLKIVEGQGFFICCGIYNKK